MPHRPTACLGLLMAALAHAAAPSAAPPDLALHKPAKASSVENDDHAAAKANDGAPDTGWTADDEPDGEPDWWQVDLGAASDLDACEITWPFDGMNYRCRVEGSADARAWRLLSDQTASRSRLRRQRLPLADARGVRYLRITITGFDDGCCAGLNEVNVFAKRSNPAPGSRTETH